MEDQALTLLVHALQQNKTLHLNIIWGTMAFQVAAIGWFISSESAQAFVRAHRAVQFVGVLATCLMGLIHYVMLYDRYRSPEQLASALADNGVFPQSGLYDLIYLSYGRPLSDVILRSVFTLTLFVLLTLMIFKTREAAPPGNRAETASNALKACV